MEELSKVGGTKFKYLETLVEALVVFKLTPMQISDTKCLIVPGEQFGGKSGLFSSDLLFYWSEETQEFDLVLDPWAINLTRLGRSFTDDLLTEYAKIENVRHLIQVLCYQNSNSPNP